MSTRFKLFALCSPGLESLLFTELQELGHKGKVLAGGVEFSADAVGLWQVSRHSRLAEAVRVRLKSFRAFDFEQLIEGAAKLPWHAYVAKEAKFSLHVTSKKSALYHTDAVSERLAQALMQQRSGSSRVGAKEPADARIFVRLDRDNVQCSIDATGQSLHKRGYRKHVVRASIRETLAAALSRLLRESLTGEPVQVSPPSVVWDPFCGAGTLLLEHSALFSGFTRTPREFAFERWPTHSATDYDGWRAAQLDADSALDADGELARDEKLHLIGSDRSAHAVKSARANAELLPPRANVSSFDWFHGDFDTVAKQVPQGAAVLGNPPYGRRLQPGEAKQGLARFEKLLQRRVDLRPVIIVTGGEAKPGAVLKDWQSVARFSNGGQPVQAWRLPKQA